MLLSKEPEPDRQHVEDDGELLQQLGSFGGRTNHSTAGGEEKDRQASLQHDARVQ